MALSNLQLEQEVMRLRAALEAVMVVTSGNEFTSAIGIVIEEELSKPLSAF